MSGLLDGNATARDLLLDTIESQLGADSPIGPRLLPGDGGLVWPAISQVGHCLTASLVRVGLFSVDLCCFVLVLSS